MAFKLLHLGDGENLIFLVICFYTVVLLMHVWHETWWSLPAHKWTFWEKTLRKSSNFLNILRKIINDQEVTTDEAQTSFTPWRAEGLTAHINNDASPWLCHWDLQCIVMVMSSLCYSNYYYNHFTARCNLSGTTWVSWYQKGKTRKVKPI